VSLSSGTKLGRSRRTVPGTIHESQTFDVSRDAARIIAVTIPDASRPRQMEIVTDWTRELERLAPQRGR
jgi:hypothetical protein